jgi:CBS domain-containing protein
VATAIREVMTTNPVTVEASAPVAEAARAMRDHDIGEVLVTQGGDLCGVLTDRDITIRGVADGVDVNATEVGTLCSRDVTVLSPDDSVEDAIQRMREQAIRRLPVVEGSRPVGVISLGDLAIDRDPGSLLADISAAPADN